MWFIYTDIFLVGIQGLAENLQDINVQNRNAYAEMIATVPILQAVSIIQMPFLIGSANIWIFSMEHARSLIPKNAGIAVGVPVALYLLYSVVQLGVFW
jgi:hypothetical protein